MRKTLIIAGALLVGTASLAVAEPSQQFAQAQMQDRSQIEREYQNRLNAARTPEERARIQAERDRLMQQGAVPNPGPNAAPSAPGNPLVPPNASEQLNYPNQPNQGKQE